MNINRVSNQSNLQPKFGSYLYIKRPNGNIGQHLANIETKLKISELIGCRFDGLNVYGIDVVSTSNNAQDEALEAFGKKLKGLSVLFRPHDGNVNDPGFLQTANRLSRKWSAVGDEIDLSSRIRKK